MPHSHTIRLFRPLILLALLCVSVSLYARIGFATDSVSNAELTIERALTFDKYTIKDQYKYQKTKRSINWDEIRRQLERIETMNASPHQWAVLQNYKNSNGEAPLIKTWKRNAHGLVTDSLNTERYQSIPLYLPSDSLTPRLYARDGVLISVTDTLSSERMWCGEIVSLEGTWTVPKRYLRPLPPHTSFNHIIIVDRKQQHIITLERIAPRQYLVRSMNPATTGVNKPPHAKPTPLGIFLIQQKKAKMLYTKDGSSELAGFAPWASRFSAGAYIHGVPVNNVTGNIVEYNNSLGTTPRSHMCVRNASSHAKFIYDNYPTLTSLVIVIE